MSYAPTSYCTVALEKKKKKKKAWEVATVWTDARSEKGKISS